MLQFFLNNNFFIIAGYPKLDNLPITGIITPIINIDKTIYMPRHLLKRFMLDESKIKKHPVLSKLGLQDPNLWHLNRKSVSAAFLVGIFCAFLPIPLQMLLAAFLAILIRCNLPLSVGLVWISNPITIPPIFYVCYLVGTFLLGTEIHHESSQFSVEWLTSSLSQIWAPLVLGSLACAVFFSLLSFFLIRFLWTFHVIKKWKERKEKRAVRAARARTKAKIAHARNANARNTMNNDTTEDIR